MAEHRSIGTDNLLVCAKSVRAGGVGWGGGVRLACVRWAIIKS